MPIRANSSRIFFIFFSLVHVRDAAEDGLPDDCGKDEGDRCRHRCNYECERNHLFSRLLGAVLAHQFEGCPDFHEGAVDALQVGLYFLELHTEHHRPFIAFGKRGFQ